MNPQKRVSEPMGQSIVLQFSRRIRQIPGRIFRFCHSKKLNHPRSVMYSIWVQLVQMKLQSGGVRRNTWVDVSCVFGGVVIDSLPLWKVWMVFSVVGYNEDMNISSPKGKTRSRGFFSLKLLLANESSFTIAVLNPSLDSSTCLFTSC